MAYCTTASERRSRGDRTNFTLIYARPLGLVLRSDDQRRVQHLVRPKQLNKKD